MIIFVIANALIELSYFYEVVIVIFIAFIILQLLAFFFIDNALLKLGYFYKFFAPLQRLLESVILC